MNVVPPSGAVDEQPCAGSLRSLFPSVITALVGYAAVLNNVCCLLSVFIMERG